MIRNLTLTLLSLFLLSLPRASAQNIGKLYFLDDDNLLATLDPNTADGNPISPAAVFSGTLAPGTVAVDAEGNRLFFVVADTAQGTLLITVDLDTGIAAPPFILSFSPSFLAYHCQDSLLYAVDGTNTLVSIDPESGAAAAIAPVAPPAIDSTTFTLDPYGNRLLFINSGPLSLELFALSTETGEVLTRLDIGDDISFSNMKYNCRDGQLYGLLDTGPATFARLDPVSATITPLSGPVAPGSFLANSHSLSQSRQAYTFSGIDENGTARLYTLALADGAILSQPAIGPNYFLNNGIAYANRCSAEADFGITSACAGEATSFTNTSTLGASLLWNFGDPASGEANTSTEANPTHVYNNPGVYTITLIATDCGADTLSKELQVIGLADSPFPDSTLACKDDFPVTLNAFTPGTEGATYLWQDESADSTFIVEEADIPLEATVEITLGACVSEFTTFVDLAPDTDCPCLLEMPSAFTPNGDTHNDFFGPVDRNCRIKAGSYTLRVYNRWGEVVFEGTDPDALGWDGNFNNEPQPSEVYFYTLQYISETDQGDVPGEKSGDVTLLR
ncbi:MAG: gliding motility-associated C-terminal domain-containing protein [Lewinellaceae bacterium]|nr:gliding motility-associated C-terminal domain-containing protein [Lewinellaceae bacterium]